MCFLSFRCRKEKNQNIPSELMGYVEIFYAEANKRGWDIKLADTDITIRFSKLQNANGTCYPKKNLIEIDSINWQRRNVYNKEWLIYHELGHCVSGRGHLIKALPRGECESIMSNSENFNCSINFKSLAWRKYYFDELFLNKSILPDWYNDVISQSVDTIQLYNGIDNNFRADSFLLAVPNLDVSKDFILSVSFNNTSISRDLRIRIDDKIIQYISTKDFNSTIIQNTNKYIYGVFNNVKTSDKVALQVAKKGNHYIFAINNQTVYVMDFEAISDKTFKIFGSSTDSNFEYQLYYYK